MATNTTNFGWDIPQSTDLVKDGATAIATLGQDIDTQFAAVSINTQTAASYTAVLADGLNKIITMDYATANDFKIPTDASVAFPTGTVLNIYCKGAGTTTISAVSSGTTTITSAAAVAASPTLTTKKACSAVKIASNYWIVVGSVA